MITSSDYRFPRLGPSLLFYHLQKLLGEQCRAFLQKKEKVCPGFCSAAVFSLPMPSPHLGALLKSKRGLTDVAVIPGVLWPTFRCCSCICAVTADPAKAKLGSLLNQVCLACAAKSHVKANVLFHLQKTVLKCTSGTARLYAHVL